MGDAIKLGDAGEYVTVSKRESKHDGMNVDVYSMRIEGANDQHTDFWNLYDWQVQFIVDELNKVDNLTNQLEHAKEPILSRVDLTEKLARSAKKLQIAEEVLTLIAEDRNNWRRGIAAEALRKIKD